jgi:hypothetical protein
VTSASLLTISKLVVKTVTYHNSYFSMKFKILFASGKDIFLLLWLGYTDAVKGMVGCIPFCHLPPIIDNFIITNLMMFLWL